MEQEKKIAFQERRACIRFKIPGATVNYFTIPSSPFSRSKLEEAFCPLYDISRGGVRFLSQREIPLESHLELEIKIPGESVPLKMKGRVRWIAPFQEKNYYFQIGVQFSLMVKKRNKIIPAIWLKLLLLNRNSPKSPAPAKKTSLLFKSFLSDFPFLLQAQFGKNQLF